MIKVKIKNCFNFECFKHLTIFKKISNCRKIIFFLFRFAEDAPLSLFSWQTNFSTFFLIKLINQLIKTLKS
uniref:Uncharacterized protein n=1 Tax=Strongyloides papillosus TaxID=174720 RepID=A0A0N5C905_STREA